MPCTQKTLGIPRLFHATTKIRYHKTKDNDERDQSECVKFVDSFSLLTHAHNDHDAVLLSNILIENNR